MMFSRLYRHSCVKNILVITLSSIGDVVLTAPVIDILLRDFPQAKLSLVVGPKAVSLFKNNPRIHQVHIFDKKWNFLQRAQWNLSLRRYHYDTIVDLRNSMIGYFLWPKWLTPPASPFQVEPVHLKDRHLNRLRSLYDFDPNPAPTVPSGPAPPLAIAASEDDKIFVEALLKPFLGWNSAFAVIAPNAADSAKTWPADEFVGLINTITSKYGLKVVLIGSEVDKGILESMSCQVHTPVLNLAGCTDLGQTVALLQKAKIVIAHDSGPMHIASYLNKPLVALFGPTDPQQSGPWSRVFKVVRRNDQCQRCLAPQLSIPHQCMGAITQQDVLEAFREVYGSTRYTRSPHI